MNHKPNIYKANTCPPCPPTASFFEKCVYWLGIGLGSGLPKRAAGTWGTVGGVIIALPLLYIGVWALAAAVLIGLAIGNYICGKTSRLMGVHDDPHIVFDEWVGVWIALLPVAIMTDGLWRADVWIGIAVAFVLFRLFDVVKPFPISWADKRVDGGFGIMLDDILAGLMAAIVLMVSAYLFVAWMIGQYGK